MAGVMLISASWVTVHADTAKMPQYQSTARQMEKLNRGLIAVRTTAAPNNGIANGVYLSWRLLGDESLTNQAFDIYRNNVRIYTTGTHDATCYTDTGGTEKDVYKVVKKGENPNAEPGTAVWKEWAKYARGSYVGGLSRPNAFSYVDIPLVRPNNVKNHGGGTSTYYNGNAGANDASVGDLDGDGDYEIVLKWDPSDSKDAASGGYTGNVYIDAYEIDENNGGYMWRIDLGKNIRAGAHTTQFMVYDFDGDGKSEIAMKTAPGSIDGTGHYVTEAGDTDEIRNADNRAVYLSGKGIPTSGGEYVTVFDGATGKALYTTEGITRNAVSDWGDSKWNRSERYLAAVAYLDGKTPYYIECRGYYNAAVVRAYKWDGITLDLVWEHKGTSKGATSLYGQGNHNLSVADVDLDGFDEIVYGSAVLDHNGTAMANTYLGHGDAMHVSDFNNDGVQEVFSVKEKSEGYKHNAADFRVAGTGQNIFGVGAGGDTGRGLMTNADDDYASKNPNALALGWTSSHANVFDLTGKELNAKPNTNSRIMTNFAVYWDGDLGRELLDDNQLAKYYADTGATVRFYNDGAGYLPASSNNDSKQTPSLSVDLWGDWREEIIMPIGKGEGETPYLRIMTSVLPTTYRLTTLMHDSQYRTAIAWQNVAYNQPPHPSYYIGSAALARDASGVYQNYLAPAVKYTSVYYPEQIAAEGVKLSQTAVTLKEGQSMRITAQVLPENATVKSVNWTSSNENVAKVTGGVITAIEEGECVITATTRDGGFTASCKVNVKAVETIDALDEGFFYGSGDGINTGKTYASVNLSESSSGAYFARKFTPFYKNKATLSFGFNTGGIKTDGTNWNWDGHEYSFGIEFLDTFGNNILNIAQSYKSSAQATAAKIAQGNFENIQQTWAMSGSGEEPMNRSSTTWYVTIEFDYDSNICTASIAGSDRQKKYTKIFDMQGMSFEALNCWLTVDGAGTVSAAPSLFDLAYTVTLEQSDGRAEIINTRDKTVKFVAYDKNSDEGELIGAAYNSEGALVFAESLGHISLLPVPYMYDALFTKSVNDYVIGLFVWNKSGITPVIGTEKTPGTSGKIDAAAFAASSEPEAQNPAINACDGDLSTCWASQGTADIIFDLGNAYAVTETRLAFIKYNDKRIIPFTVSASEDGESWEIIYKGNSVPFNGDFMDFYLPNPALCRYVKLTVEGNTVSGWSSVSEFEIYGYKL